MFFLGKVLFFTGQGHLLLGKVIFSLGKVFFLLGKVVRSKKRGLLGKVLFY